MYYKCRSIGTSEIMYIDTEHNLELGNVFHYQGNPWEVILKIDPKSKEAERISSSELKRKPHIIV